MLGSTKLNRFARTLGGVYSNFKQSQNHPTLYAHIKLFFIPIKTEKKDSLMFYSEQSFDYNPWSPYRQSIQKIHLLNQRIIVDNYYVKDGDRVAGAGTNPELLNGIKKRLLGQKIGCSMHFTEKESGHYFGHIEQGNRCIIKYEGEETYIISKVKFSNSYWESLDEGFNVKTHKKVWGSANGPIIFEKIKVLKI